MRVTRKVLRRLDVREERGAVLVFVALALVAILGMVVLTVDVGGLAVKHRSLVNANDAAALSAAEAFARDQAQVGVNEGPAQTQADTLATQNVSDATHDTSQPWFVAIAGIPGISCDPSQCGSVTVRFEGPQALFFAPILGFGDQTTVHGTATAIWGPAGGGNPAPTMLRSDWLNPPWCTAPVTVATPPPVECDFWLNNKDDNGNSLWAWMNLNAWNVSSTYNCPSSGGATDRRDWINGIKVPAVTINPPPTPTFVCTASGKASANFQDMYAQIGHIKIFPINDAEGLVAPPGQVDSSGTYCPPNTACTPDKYDIVGLLVLRIDDVLHGDDAAAVGTPAVSGSCSPNHDFTQTGTGKTWDLTTQSCNITGLHYPGDLLKPYPKLSKKVGSNPVTVYTYGVDYTYDALTKVITWTRAQNVNNVQVAWDYFVDATPGKCGEHPSDPNAICLVVSWRGPQPGGINPGGGGIDYGLRAIRLSN